MKRNLRPVLQCIYCGAKDVKLSDEHIVPYSLGGQWLLPKASCEECAIVTSRLERTVARNMYLLLRTKAGFRTRRKKNRPTSMEASYTLPSGEIVTKSVPIEKYPNLYPVLHLPPPGILTNAPQSEFNPEFKLDLVGDNKEIAELQSYFPAGVSVRLGVEIHWGDFCRMLAKIAHAQTVATCGLEFYEPLLPSVVLGGYPYLSHLVGGVDQQSSIAERRGVDGISVEITNDDHIIVKIDILGGRMPQYSVVSGRITEHVKFMTNVFKISKLEQPGYQHGVETRFMFTHDWIWRFQRETRAMIRIANRGSEIVDQWPLLQGYEFEVYAVPPSHLFFIVRDKSEDLHSGPNGAVRLPSGGHPVIPTEPSELDRWYTFAQTEYSLGSRDAFLILPVRDCGKNDTDGDLKLFSEQERDLWTAQTTRTYNTHAEFMRKAGNQVNSFIISDRPDSFWKSY